MPDAKVKSRTLGRLLFDVRMKIKCATPWETILRRNEWFGLWLAGQVRQVPSRVIFSYSYTARLPFQAARPGAIRLLGQIDPGPREEHVVLEATKNYQHLASSADRAPQKYWDLWREEIALADKIAVNSPWSAKLLVEAGVAAEKLVEIPLVYAPEVCNGEVQKRLHLRDPVHRLRVLFLGSVCLRKGVGQLFKAISVLNSELVDFTFAGPVVVQVPDDLRAMTNVRFLGPVDRGTAERLYAESDVFLFPTLSDGFGRTQLEALGHGCPVIASTNCARVIENRWNGLVLEEVTPEAIAESIMELVRDRDLLAQLQANACVPDKFHPRHLAPALLALEESHKGARTDSNAPMR